MEPSSNKKPKNIFESYEENNPRVKPVSIIIRYIMFDDQTER